MRDRKFEFVGFDKVLNPLGNNLEIPVLDPFSAVITKNTSGNFQLQLGFRAGYPSYDPNAKTVILGSVPIKCSTELEVTCAQTRVQIFYPGMNSGRRSSIEKPKLLILGWLTNPRQFSTELYVLREKGFEPVSLPSMASKLTTTEQMNWSVKPAGIQEDQKTGRLKLHLLVKPVISTPQPVYIPLPGQITPQAVIDNRCQQYKVTLVVDIASAEIDTVNFAKGNLSCRGKSFPEL